MDMIVGDVVTGDNLFGRKISYEFEGSQRKAVLNMLDLFTRQKTLPLV